jgi:hypothetical protein
MEGPVMRIFIYENWDWSLPIEVRTIMCLFGPYISFEMSGFFNLSTPECLLYVLGALLTYLLHGAESFLSSWLACR